MWAQAIGESASSSWPTVRANEASGSYQRDRGKKGKERPTLNGLVREWSTPTASESANRTTKTIPSVLNGNHGAHPSAQAAEWPTPMSRDSDESGGRGGVVIGGTFYRPGIGERMGANLSDVAEGFTPPALIPETGPGSLEMLPISRRRLNPAFVCWLMGWPWHWTLPEVTSFGAEATAWWWARQQQALCIFSGGFAHE